MERTNDSGLQDESSPDHESIAAAWIGCYIWLKYGVAGLPSVDQFREALAEFRQWGALRSCAQRSNPHRLN